jgi:hypothetical protein
MNGVVVRPQARRGWGAAAAPLLLAVLTAGWVWWQERLLTGVVQDSASAAPVAGALVSQVRGERAVVRTTTEGGGRFALRLQGPAPYELRVEQLGYEPATIPLEAEDVAEGEVHISLVAQPVLLEGLGVQTDREKLEFWLGNQRVLVTEQGAFTRYGLATGMCHLYALDGVVIRDPRLLLPEVIRSYSPARYVMTETGWLHVPAPLMLGGPLGTPDSRLKADAYPCEVANFRHGTAAYRSEPRGSMYRRVDLPPRHPPEPDAPSYDLVPVDGSPSGAVTAGAFRSAAVAADGRVALVAGTDPVVRLLDAQGKSSEIRNLAREPAALGAITHLGWRGDTVWAADAGRGRTVMIEPGGGPVIVAPHVPLLFGDTVQGAASDAWDPELRVPVPMAGGRWLSVQRARAAPFPPRLQDEPARRTLALFDGAGRLERVLATLRPGPWRIDLEAAGTPIEPFRDHPLYAVGPDGDHVTIVQRALEVAVWMDIYTVTRIGLDGDTIFHLERPVPLIRISDAALSGAAGEVAADPAVQSVLGSHTMARSVVRAMLYRTPFHPPISLVVVGRDGATWLRWPDERTGTVRWDVLDETGQPLRTLTLDRRLEILAADAESVWGTLPDGRHGTRLVHYRIRPR